MLQPLSSLKNTQSGRVYLICNGPSAKDFNWENRPICGINRAYLLGSPDWSVGFDSDTRQDLDFWKLGGHIFYPEGSYPGPMLDVLATSFNCITGDNWYWCDDPTKQPIFVGFTLYTACQLMVWMGFRDLVVVGWDMEVGKHIAPKRTFTNEAFLRQAQGAHRMAEAAKKYGFSISVVGGEGHPLVGLFPIMQVEELWA